MPSTIGNAIKIFIGCIKKEREDIIGVVPKKREILILPFEKPLHLEEAQLSTGVLLSRLSFCSVKDKKLMHKKFLSTHTILGKRTLRV